MKTSTITHIYEGFKNHTLPKDEWTHEAHLITALMLLNDLGLDEAEARMPDMIRTYNVACGGINSDSEGYHHTITIFYLRVIDAFRMKYPDLDIEELASKLLTSKIAEPYFTLQYYSKDVLFTPEARLGLVPPNLQDY